MSRVNGQVFQLDRWKVAKVRKGNVWTVHAYGYVAASDDGWVSPPITKWDEATSTITTKTGDRFRLEGEPGTSRDADAAWAKFLSRGRYKDEDVYDISSRYHSGKVIV